MEKTITFLKKHKDEIIVITTFSFFLFMMLYNLMHSALWNDEWVEYRYSQASIINGDLYKKIISTFQPPLYNFVMHFWLNISQSLVWFRLFNVLLGIISAGFLFSTVKKLCNKYIACVTLVVLAVCYRWIYCIQECSEYTLMLLGLFAAIYFYVCVEEKFTYPKMCAFILSCIVAIYSQYGAAFVVLPLLLFFYFGNILDKENSVKKKVVITSSYLISLVCFAVPLYVYFLKKQMQNNEISEHAIALNWSMLAELPVKLGQMIGYFFNQTEGAWSVIWGIASIVLIGGMIAVLKKGISCIKRSLILSLLLAYGLHFILVELQVYAMTHPGSSAGFFARYSYFYMPLLSVVLPVILYEISKYNLKNIKKVIIGICGAFIIILSSSFCDTMQNWNKALDDVFAEIWIENEGWKDTTYLISLEKSGLYHYLSETEGYKEEYLESVDLNINPNVLPTKFWLWRINIDKASLCETTMWVAERLGYTVDVYVDEGYKGQLVYCHLDDCELIQEEVLDLKLLSAVLDENGMLYISFTMTDSEEKYFNQYRYQVSTHIYDTDGTIQGWDVGHAEPEVFITNDCYTIKINTKDIGMSSYDILLDMYTPEGTWYSWFEETLVDLPVIKVRDGEIVEYAVN